MQYLTLIVIIILFAIIALVMWCVSGIGSRKSYNPNYTKVSQVNDAMINEDRGILDLTNGNPLMYENFWKKELPQSDPSIGYQFETPDKLRKSIVDGMKYTHQVDIDPEQLVIGNGTLQLIVAYIMALKKLRSEPENRLLVVMIHKPTYPIIIDSIKMIGGVNVVDSDYTEQPDIEYIVSPSNPIGETSTALSNAPYRLYDHSYAWPQFTDDYREEFQLSQGYDRAVSFSKGLGIAGFRCGFIQIHDPDLRQMVSDMIILQTLGTNTAGYTLYDKIISDRLLVDRVISYGTSVLQNRWKRLLEIKDPSLINSQGAYAWFRRPAYQFEQEGIRATSGSTLLATDEYSRIPMILDDISFNIFLVRLRRLQQVTMI
jgi:aspartate/methionine/tyrosine aminotransferase